MSIIWERYSKNNFCYLPGKSKSKTYKGLAGSRKMTKLAFLATAVFSYMLEGKVSFSPFCLSKTRCILYFGVHFMWENMVHCDARTKTMEGPDIIATYATGVKDGAKFFFQLHLSQFGALTGYKWEPVFLWNWERTKHRPLLSLRYKC